MAETYPVVGIDFGTSNSVCFIFSKGAPECVKFNYQLFTPSCYSFRDGDEHCGEVAKNLMKKQPESVIYDMKRYIGKHEYEFREMFDHFHYLFSLHENGKGQLYYSHPDQNGTNHRVFASAVVSKLYSYIIDEAREQLRQEVEYGVITVPAYFTDQQIEILKKAAQIAGLRQLDVIPEPTAAALAYQCGRPNSKLLIYDLGGGTFDVCILEVTIDGYKVIKCGGDPFLGGRDFDQRMLALIKKKLECNGVDVNALTDNQLAYLQSQAEEAKIALSMKGVIHATVSLNESFGGIEEVYIRKEEFENSIRDLIAHTCDLVEDYLDELDIELTDTDTIGLVGGSSQIPLVRTMLEERFCEVDICAEGNTTTIVAKGACMRAFQQYCRMHNIPIPIDYQEKKINQFLNQPIFLRIGMNLERPVLKQGSPIGRKQRVVYHHVSDSKQVDVVVLKGIQEIGHFPLDVEKGKSVELVVCADVKKGKNVELGVRARDNRVVNVRPNGGREKSFPVNNWDDDEDEMNETFEDKVKPEVGPATEKEVELKSLEVAVEMWKGDREVMWSSEESKKKAFEAIEKGVEEIKKNKANEDAIHEYTLSLCGWHEELVRSTMLKEHIREHIAELMRERRRMDEGDSQNKKTILEYIDKRISDLNSGVYNSVSLEDFDKNSTNFMSWLKKYS
ncbi:hypothetical protein AV274_2473 [Blastocystis sp. ATCC 50177/Nand II]|uniref:Hsp70 n=1 Tax=Blastocystis sp. subtype 1 (strain ATCC 50177 / NandII) TaxID=478820 RepID=A0A196SFH5_BLAHN|nr:hypothetical protein AV274_2473 [Blastocystis sp. ATCC 50177/Nand II]